MQSEGNADIHNTRLRDPSPVLVHWTPLVLTALAEANVSHPSHSTEKQVSPVSGLHGSPVGKHNSALMGMFIAAISVLWKYRKHSLVIPQSLYLNV